MSLEEPGLDALFRIWATAGCGVARSASWFGADSVGLGGGQSAGDGPRFFLKAPVELAPGWFDESEVQRYTATPSSMLAMGATKDSGEDSPAAPVRQEEIEEVGGAPNDEEMPACKQEDNEEGAPEVGAPVPHVKEEPLPND